MEGLGKLVNDIGGVGITLGLVAIVGGAALLFAPEMVTTGIDYAREMMSGFFTAPNIPIP